MGSILLPIALIFPQEAGLISILVDERSGSINALGAKGDFFLDQLLAFGRTGKLAELLFEFLSYVGTIVFFNLT